MIKAMRLVVLACLPFAAPAQTFEADIVPILKSKCYQCHNAKVKTKVQSRQCIPSGMHDDPRLRDVNTNGSSRAGGHGAVARQRKQLGDFPRRTVNRCAVKQLGSARNARSGHDAKHGQQDDLFDQGTAVTRAHAARLCGRCEVHTHSIAQPVLLPRLQPAMSMRHSKLLSRVTDAPHATRAVARLVMLSVVVSIGSVLASCSGVPSTAASISTSEAIMELGAALSQLREDNALLQAQIDSLRGVTAYQDTIVRQLANLANVAVRPSSSSTP